MADITKKNTSIGATDFSAPTNNEPKITIGFAVSGIVTASIIPTIKPIIILLTKLI
jgi:hypothetical protein